MAYELSEERTLEETPTWAVAVVCFVLLAVSIFIEYIIHLIGKWLTSKHKRSLVEALEKIKSELMLLGFISLLLTVLQDPISDICIPKSIGASWLPCSKEAQSKLESKNKGRKLLDFTVPDFSYRRRLAVKGNDYCSKEGKVAFVSAYGIHQLHVFIFVLAVFHVLYCILTLTLGRYKMRKWKVWEKDTKSVEHQYYNDPERFRFARDTSFGQRHLKFSSTWSLWIVSFFRQLFQSVTKVDYLTLRHGFIMAHLAPDSEATFDFRKYISRSLEEDFKVVVEIRMQPSYMVLCGAVLAFQRIWMVCLLLATIYPFNYNPVGGNKTASDYINDGAEVSGERGCGEGCPSCSTRRSTLLVWKPSLNALSHPLCSVSECISAGLLCMEYI